MLITSTDIDKMEHINKINLVNSLTGFKPANLIGTKSINGISNVAVFSSIVHLGSNPALFGFVLRPTRVKRDTYQNINDTDYFTINHITESMIVDAHHTSAKYDSDISEFDKTNLTEVFLNDFHAPFVKESGVQIAMKYVDEYYIKQNDTILIIGEIQHINIDENVLENDGWVNLIKNKTIAINGLDAYVTPTKSKRLAYQRPK